MDNKSVTLNLRRFLSHILENDIVQSKEYDYFSETCECIHGGYVKWLGISHMEARKLAHNTMMPSEWFIFYLTGLPITLNIKYQLAFNTLKVEVLEYRRKKSLTAT